MFPEHSLPGPLQNLSLCMEQSGIPERSANHGSLPSQRHSPAQKLSLPSQSLPAPREVRRVWVPIKSITYLKMLWKSFFSKAGMCHSLLIPRNPLSEDYLGDSIVFFLQCPLSQAQFSLFQETWGHLAGLFSEGASPKHISNVRQPLS